MSPLLMKEGPGEVSNGETAMKSPADTRLTARPPRNSYRIFVVLALLFAVFLALNIGTSEAGVSTTLPVGVALRVLARHVPFAGSHIATVPAYLDNIVWNARLPRALGAALIGMLLALAGVAFQSFLQNPLADPYMVGVSSGSALGSVSVILLAGGGAAGFAGGLMQTGAAFAAGLLATGFVYLLARQNGRLSAQTFLLAGIVVGTFLWSLIPFALSIANRSGGIDRQSAILTQLLGNLEGMTWSKVFLLTPFAIVGSLTLLLSARELNLMTLGEESAAQLGLNTERFKIRVILAGALATAAAVSVAGIVAFVGLVVPHIARRLVGPDHRALLPCSVVLGSLVLTAADWLSRVYLGGLEIGVVTSLLGAPVFCYLLRRRLTARN